MWSAGIDRHVRDPQKRAVVRRFPTVFAISFEMLVGKRHLVADRPAHEQADLSPRLPFGPELMARGGLASSPIAIDRALD